MSTGETMRELIWLNGSWSNFRRFPDSAKREGCYALFLAQVGEQYDAANINNSLGIPPVLDVRIQVRARVFCLHYAVLPPGIVFVLHAYEAQSSFRDGVNDPDVVVRCGLAEALSLADADCGKPPIH